MPARTRRNHTHHRRSVHASQPTVCGAFPLASQLATETAALTVAERALDLRLQLDVLAQEVVVLLAKRLRVAALFRLCAPRFGELVEPRDQLLRIVERLQDRLAAGRVDQVHVTVIRRAEEREHDRVWTLIADRLRDRLCGQVADVLRDHRVVKLGGADPIEGFATRRCVHETKSLRLRLLHRVDEVVDLVDDEHAELVDVTMRE